MRRIILATTFITFSPALAFAMGCLGHEKQAQSCATGSVWDYEKQACVTQPTG